MRLRSIFEAIWPHVGTVFGPIAVLKTKKNPEMVVEFSVFRTFVADSISKSSRDRFGAIFGLKMGPFWRLIWTHFWSHVGDPCKTCEMGYSSSESSIQQVQGRPELRILWCSDPDRAKRHHREGIFAPLSDFWLSLGIFGVSNGV